MNLFNLFDFITFNNYQLIISLLNTCDKINRANYIFDFEFKFIIKIKLIIKTFATLSLSKDK